MPVAREVAPFVGFNVAAEKVAEWLKLLGHPQRLAIVCLLSESEYAVSEIEQKLGIHQPALSQQLGALREAGVIEVQRAARASIYKLSDDRMRQLVGALHQIFCPEGPAALAEPSTQALPLAVRASGAASFARVLQRGAGS